MLFWESRTISVSVLVLESSALLDIESYSELSVVTIALAFLYSFKDDFLS
jgi:hypothetical protein